MAKTAEKQVKELASATEKTFEQGVEKMTKSLEDATAFGQENVDAVVESSKIAAKAAETMNAELIAFSKKSYEDSVAAAKQLTSCKSVSEYVETQTDLTKSAMEAFVAEANKLNEIYNAAAKDAFAPINARFSAAVEMAKSFRL